jgi:Rod binding domain-containing protein
MFQGLETDGPFGGGNAESTFRPMLIDQYADAISKGGGVGIADSVMKEILKLQGLE